MNVQLYLMDLMLVVNFVADPVASSSAPQNQLAFQFYPHMVVETLLNLALQTTPIHNNKALDQICHTW